MVVVVILDDGKPTAVHVEMDSAAVVIRSDDSAVDRLTG